MKLYDFQLSGNCYKVRLMLALLGLTAERVEVDLMGGEQRREPFSLWNPLSQVPLLETEGHHLRDSQAILLYLARCHGPTWLPSDPLEQARVDAWMSFAANEIANGPAALRLIHKFGAPLDRARAGVITEKVFALLEGHLTSQDWLVGANPSVADLACYPYLALAPEGDWPTRGYPALLNWFRRIEALPGYVPLPGQD